MKIIDLSHSIWDEQPCYPGDPVPRVRPFDSIAEAGYNTTRLAIGSHQSTHLDAPFHYFHKGQTVDRIPLEQLYGPATLVDLAPDSELGEQASIGPPMFEAHAEAFQPGARVLYRTGWGVRFGKSGYFRRHPSLTVEAAQWIAERRIVLLGMDTPSPAEDPDEVHKILLGAGVIIVESLAHLEELPREFLFIAFPLRLTGRDGSPVRAAAVV